MSTMQPYKWFVAAAGIFLLFFNYLLPPIMGLTPVGMAVLCIFLGTILMMLLIDLVFPVLLCILAFAVNGVYTFSEALAMSLGHNIFWFVVFSGMVISTMNKTGILKRIALWAISRPFTKKSPWLFVGTVFYVIMMLGSIMDCTACIILFTAIMEEILNELNVKKGERFGEIMMFGIMVFVGVSYGMSAIGHSVPIAAIALFNDPSVNILTYCATGYVMGTIMFVVFMVLLRYVFKLDIERLRSFDPTTLEQEKKPWSKGEVICSLVYVVVIILWLAPAFLQNLAPTLCAFITRLGQTTPLIIATVVLALVFIDGRPLMDIRQEIKDGAPWGACFPVAAAMLLGAAVSNPDTGIATAISTYMGPIFGSLPPLIFIMCCCLLSGMMTNFSAGMISMMIAATVTLTLINGGAVTGISVPAMCIVVSTASSFAYATPPAGTYSAIVSGQGWLSKKNMFVWGLAIALLWCLMYGTLGYTVATWIC